MTRVARSITRLPMSRAPGRIVSVLVVLLLEPLAEVGIAWACECAAPESPARELASHAIVFAGRVVAVDDRAGCSNRGGATLEVDEAFKGTEVGAEIEVEFDVRDRTGCGSIAGRFDVGERWLIFTQVDERGLASCSPMLGLGQDLPYSFCPEPGEHQWPTSPANFACGGDTDGGDLAPVEMTEDEVLSELRDSM
jgi:hypothetical protein